MTPRGGTIPEVKSGRRNHDVHSMESSSSTGAGCSKTATHARSLVRAEENPLLSTGALGIRANASHARAAAGEKLRPGTSSSRRTIVLKARRFEES